MMGYFFIKQCELDDTEGWRKTWISVGFINTWL